MSKVSDLSLIVYLTVVNGKKLEDTMVKWSGCDKEVYTKNVLVDIYQSALSDITNAYHIPNMFYYYFDAKKQREAMRGLSFQYTDLDVVKSPLHWIPVKTWDEEDKNRLKELKKEYIDIGLTGTARVSTDPSINYPICPHCKGHHTKQLYGTATLSSGRNDVYIHYKCLDCGKEFDKEI